MKTITPLTLVGLALAGCATPAARPLFASGDVVLSGNRDVVVARATMAVTLPAAAKTGRLFTVRAAGGDVKVRAAAGERIEGMDAFALEDGEMATFMADGSGGWVIISSSDL
jgi:hypothetical protein